MKIDAALPQTVFSSVECSLPSNDSIQYKDMFILQMSSVTLGDRDYPKCAAIMIQRNLNLFVWLSLFL